MAASLARESVLSFLIPAKMAGRRANKRPEESSSSGEPEWRISGRQHMVESHGLTVTRTTEDFEESTIAMTATAMVGDQRGSDILLVPAQEVQQKKKAEAKERAREAAKQWLEKRAARTKEVITVPEEAAKTTERGRKGHRGDCKGHRGHREDHRVGPEGPGDDRGDGGPQKSKEGCLGGSSLGQGGRGGKEAEGSREDSGPRCEEDASGPGGQEEAGKPQIEACWATGGGQGPSQVAGPARYPRAGGHSSADAVCQAQGEEEARVPDACREQCAEEGPREGPGRTSGEKDVGGPYERSPRPMPGGRDQGPLRGGDDQRDHQGANHATTAEDNAGAGFRVREANEGAEDQGIRWVGAAFVVADATSRSCSTTIANATQGTIAGNMVRSYSPNGQGRQGRQRKRRPQSCPRPGVSLSRDECISSSVDASLADLEKVAFGHVCVGEHACVGELGGVELGEHVEHGRHVVLDQKPAQNEQDEAWLLRGDKDHLREESWGKLEREHVLRSHFPIIPLAPTVSEAEAWNQPGARIRSMTAGSERCR